jgi:DHA1 family inner membrane transport protein
MPPRATLIGATFVFASGHVIAAVSDSFNAVLVARVVTALATGTFWATGAVVASAAAGPTARARALSVMSAGLSLAVVAGVPLGTFAGLFTGWRGPFWMLAGLALVVGIALVQTDPAAFVRGQTQSVRNEVSQVRAWRMWAVLAAIVLAQGGFLGAYSFVSPLLTDRAGVAHALVPLVLVGFGIGALVGTVVGGRLGDRHPLATIAAAVSASAAAMLILAATSTHPLLAIVAVIVMGAAGLGANPVLIAQTLRFAGEDSTLGSSLATAAFNLGTAGGSAVAAATLSTSLGLVGPPMLGAAITASALVPLWVLAASVRRRAPAHPTEQHPNVPTTHQGDINDYTSPTLSYQEGTDHRRSRDLGPGCSERQQLLRPATHQGLGHAGQCVDGPAVAFRGQVQRC